MNLALLRQNFYGLKVSVTQKLNFPWQKSVGVDRRGDSSLDICFFFQ